uniref:Purine nucleoside phosphorylase n=1 Tax=Plectus sambesii TaxID=2011161 RepID=A0A914W3D3_9BILA
MSTLIEVHPTVDPINYDDILNIVNHVRSQVTLTEEPKIGIICGSGLGDLAELLTERQVIPFTNIPGFPPTNVIGHKGNLVFGNLMGKFIVCLQGRFHPYEHSMNLALCAMPVRMMKEFGVRTLIISNAAGGVNSAFKWGDLMLIKDQLFLPGLAGFSPLVGINDPRMGPRFVSMHDAYDLSLRQLAHTVAHEQGIVLHQGIYVMCGGPQYESPAEVCMFKTVGADALGMSTCHEVTVARQCGIRVLGFSLITNIANQEADTAVEVSHEEVLVAAKEASERACKFVSGIVEKL